MTEDWIFIRLLSICNYLEMCNMFANTNLYNIQLVIILNTVNILTVFNT